MRTTSIPQNYPTHIEARKAASPIAAFEKCGISKLFQMVSIGYDALKQVGQIVGIIQTYLMPTLYAVAAAAANIYAKTV